MNIDPEYLKAQFLTRQVYLCTERSASRSRRWLRAFIPVVRQDQTVIENITLESAQLLGLRYDPRHGGIVYDGTGYNPSQDFTTRLSEKLFGDPSALQVCDL